MPKYNSIQSGDTISGGMASVHIFVDDVEWDAFWIKSYDVTSHIAMGSIKSIGSQKSIPVPGEVTVDGNLNGYYGTRVFSYIHTRYKDTNKYPKVEMLIHEEDPASNRGARVLEVKNVFFTDATIGNSDDSSQAMEASTPFQAYDYNIIQDFNDLSRERV